MKVDPMERTIALAGRLAGSEWVRKLGLQRPVEKLAYVGTREGFRAVRTVARSFKAAQRLVRPERLPAAGGGRSLFDLSLSDEQEMVRELMQRFAEGEVRPAAAEADARARPPEGFARAFAGLGIAQYAVPEALGGAAAESWEVTHAVIAEELGYGDMGLAVAALAPVGAANALARWGSAEQQSRYLPPFAEEAPPAATVALSEPRAAFDPQRLRTRARQDAEGFVLSGEKSAVPLAEEAELFLVAAELVGHGPAVFVVEAGTPGVTPRRDDAMGLRAAALGSLALEEARVGPDALLGGAPGALDYAAFVDRLGLGACALAVGTGRAVLDYASEYANGRIAFGEPITNRQSVAFMLAEMAIEVDALRLLVWRAACRAEEGRPFHREAYLARAFALEKARRIATDGVQVLGGHGYTKEHPVERWYRDLMAVGTAESGPLL